MFRRSSTGHGDAEEDGDAPTASSERSDLLNASENTNSSSGLLGLGPMQRILSRIYSTPRVHLSFSTSDEVGAQIAHGGGAVLSASPSQPSGDQTPVLPAAALDDAEAGVHRQTTFDEEGGLPELSADLGAEAERLRLTAPNMSLDVRQALRSLESSAIPFALLVLLVFVLHHLVSIAVFAWGTFVLHRSNQKLQAQVARRAEVQRLSAVALFAMLVVHAGVVSALGLSNTIYLIMSLSGAPLGTDFWSVLFTAGLADLFSRLLVAATKALIIASAPAASQQTLRRRGGMLTALDYLAAALRAVVPAPLWVAYFRHAGLASPISIVLSGIYILFKAANMIERVSLAGVAMAQWQGAVHGAPPTPEELTAGIQECSICQDEFRSPLRLTCGHIFCGSCIGEWLDREATCPMCRSVVRRATLRPKNDGSTSLLPLLC